MSIKTKSGFQNTPDGRVVFDNQQFHWFKKGRILFLNDREFKTEKGVRE
jgi:hypothetical protein